MGFVQQNWVFGCFEAFVNKQQGRAVVLTNKAIKEQEEVEEAVKGNSVEENQLEVKDIERSEEELCEEH